MGAEGLGTKGQRLDQLAYAADLLTLIDDRRQQTGPQKLLCPQTTQDLETGHRVARHMTSTISLVLRVLISRSFSIFYMGREKTLRPRPQISMYLVRMI